MTHLIFFCLSGITALLYLISNILNTFVLCTLSFKKKKIVSGGRVNLVCLILLKVDVFAVVNKIYFSISISTCSLLMYKSTVGFCELTIYFAKQRNSYSSFLLVDHIRAFSMIMLSVNKDSFTSSFYLFLSPYL